MRPHTKLFVSSDECEGVFGEGKYQLLCAVQERGSISKAAASLGRSYRKAWGDIKRAELALGQQLIVRTRGGADGGQSELTVFAGRLLAAWEKHRRAVFAAADKSYTRHLRTLLGPLEQPAPGKQNRSGKQKQ
jgi:molybdate transport system regulatory protein